MASQLRQRLRLNLNKGILTTALALSISTALPAFAQSTEDTTAAPAPSTLQTFINQTHLGGYGEMTYKNPNNGDVPRLNLPRVVTFIEHDFNADWEFKSELELENVKLERGEGGEIEYEQAFLDYHANPYIGIRTGLQLIPIGMINQTHEPTTYFSVERPQFDQSVIRTEWEEIGAQLYGEIAQGLEYQVMVSEGIKGEGISMDGLDGAKQSGSAGDMTSDAIAGSDASHPSVSGRLDYYPIAGLRVGASAYFQDRAFDSLPGGENSSFFMAMLDGRFVHGPLHISGEGGFFNVGADGAALYHTPTTAAGGWVEIGYNLFSLFPDLKSELLPFIMEESYTFTAPAPPMTPGSISIHHQSLTAGVAYRPLSNIIFKADYRMTNITNEQNYRQFSLGGGFDF